MANSRPIADLTDDKELTRDRWEKLQQVLEIRNFASSELHLPENNSYRNYADIGRPYVVWSLVATPEFSLTPKTWCFPFAGCVSYRGYFSQQDATEFADRLHHEGHDVYIGGVSAYSTLGWFDDPLPSSVIDWSEYRLAGLIFHELAHQKLYVSDDSGFNEAFAVTVAREGVRRWQAHYPNHGRYQTYLNSEKLTEDFLKLLFSSREKLQKLYASTKPDQEMRHRKAAIFLDLQRDYRIMREGWGGDPRYDKWFNGELNNAKLASVATYHELVPGFAVLLKRYHDDLPGFYTEVETLAQYDRKERRKRLTTIPTPENSHVGAGDTGDSNQGSGDY
ncbi:MAG: aminopeptidase [Gammaproteobacteria bacterium]|nr:aminopeptidase [Gammaproteobacteria bacterium]